MTKLFLEFELDEELFELRRHGRSVATQGRVFDLIAYLVRHRDRVVSKDELTRELWGASVTSDTAISQVVKLARKALCDEGKSQRVIKTVRGRGFRFIAEVSKPPKCDARTVTTAAAASPSHEVEPPSAPPPALPSPQHAPNLVGREAELARMVHGLANLRRGRGGLLLLAGDPGTGKTTLVEAFAAEATAQDFDLYWGRSWDEHGTLPFWPWNQVLRAIVKRDGEGPTLRYASTVRGDLAELLPELQLPRAAPAPASAEPASPYARFQLFDDVVQFLRSACQYPQSASSPQRHRVIIFDDLHAFDEASIELLRFLAPELDEMALLVVGTYSDQELAEKPSLAKLVGSAADNQLMRLNVFERAQVLQLLLKRVKQPPSDAFVDTLLSVSAGNPLLLSEILRRLDPDRPDTWPDLTESTIPGRILASVRRLMRGLSPRTIEVLAVAAALDREFSLPRLAAFCGLAEPEVMVELEPAITRGIVRRVNDASDRFVFSHSLTRSAIYADLSVTKRIELHRRIAEQLEQSADVEQLPLYEIAHHYRLAAPSGCRQKAIDYAELAAKRAYTTRAYELSASLYDRALQLSDSQQVNHARLDELLSAAGHAWYQAGQLERATACYDRAATLARSDQNWERFGNAVLNSVQVLRGSFLHDRTRQQQIREALQQLPNADTSLRANLLAASTIGGRAQVSREQRDETARAAVEMARRLDDEPTLLRTLTARHYNMWGSEHPRAMLAVADEMVALGRKLQDHEALLDALLCRIQDYGALGEHNELFRDHEEYVAEAEHFGSPWHHYMLLVFRAAEASVTGAFDQGIELSEAALRQGVRVRDPLAPAFHAVRVLFITLMRGVRGASAEARALLVQPPDYLPEDYHSCWALAAAMSGDRNEAGNRVARLLVQDKHHMLLGPLRRPLLTIAALTCTLIGDRSNAEQLYNTLLPDAGLHLALQAGVHLGPVCFYLGTVASFLGWRDKAIAHFEQALSQCEYIRTWSARVQLSLARELGPAGGSRTRSLLMAAETTASQVGMSDVLAAVRAESSRALEAEVRNAN